MWLRYTLLICDNWTLLRHNPVTKKSLISYQPVQWPESLKHFLIFKMAIKNVEKKQNKTCSVTNSKALSNIWLPYKEVMAIKRNRPSRTGVGISVRGMGNINSDNAMRVLERNPVSLVSLTLTILQKKKNTLLKSLILICFFFKGSNSLS